MVAPLYFFYSFFWQTFGWLGRLLYLLNHTYLNKFGYHKRFKIFSESQLQQFDKDETGLEEDEAEMVQNIFDLSSIVVKEIFTPRVDMVAIEVSTTYIEAIERIRAEKFTRIPVYQENMDNIQGILHAKDLLGLEGRAQEGSFSLSDIIRPAYFVPRSKKVDDLMGEFKVSHHHMAIVVDEYGGTAGLITLEDILEEIVGEIQDEDDREDPVISKVDKRTYLIDPIITLDDFNKKLNIHLPLEEEVEVDTLGGYLQYLKGSIPKEGDVVLSQGHSFEITKMDGQSMEQVQLTLSVS
jgi:CBS domain containing-hemolysin-like protein